MRRPPALLLAALVGLAPACGHRGDPLPPRRRTPPPLQGFRLAQRGDALEVRAVAPGASVDGVPYESLTIEFLSAEGQMDLEKAGVRHAVKAVAGGPVALNLPLPAPGTMVRAAARGVAGRERGPRTLIMALVTQAPLEAPSELTAALVEDGVALSWRGPRPKEVAPPVLAPKTPPSPRTPGAPPAPGSFPRPGSPPPPAEAPAEPARGETASPVGESAGEGPLRHGFFVYRRTGDTPYGAPLLEEPVERRNLGDGGAPRGATVCYVVRAVASTEPLIESAPSNEACVEVRDVSAPATPDGLAVLPREGGLELLWSPSGEPDLAGYRIYRIGPSGQRERVAEVGGDRSSWVDRSVQPAVVYRYALSAVDQAGNESELSETVEGSLQ